MKVIIAGSRSITDYKLVEKAVKDSKFKITEIFSGMAPGVDTLAIEYAKNNKIPLREFPAEWDNLKAERCVVGVNKFGKEYNKLAGFNRNALMAENSDAAIILIANNSSGSEDMYAKMKELKKKVFVVYL